MLEPCVHLRGYELRLAQARFPRVKTLEQFDFCFQPSIDARTSGDPACASGS